MIGPDESAPGPTPFDSLWSWLATGTLSAAVVTFTLLSVGQPFVLGGQTPLAQTDAKVTIAYFGSLVSAAGLLALGLIALRFLTSPEAAQGIRWPRYTLLESEVRRPDIARVALVAILLIPAAAIYAALYKYLRDSHVACWDASHPLASGFFTSRIAAMSTSCSSPGFFRMVQKDGQEPYAVQWFFWSDPLLILTLIAAVGAWGLYLRRAGFLKTLHSC